MGCLKQTTVNITTAQVVALNTTPVELIPTPGAGKAIVVLAGYIKANASGITTPYADNRQLYIQTNNADTPQQSVLSILQSTTTILHQFLNSIISPGTNDQQIIANEAVMLTSNGDTTNPVVPFSLDVYLLYQIVDL